MAEILVNPHLCFGSHAPHLLPNRHGLLPAHTSHRRSAPRPPHVPPAPPQAAASSPLSTLPKPAPPPTQHPPRRLLPIAVASFPRTPPSSPAPPLPPDCRGFLPAHAPPRRALPAAASSPRRRPLPPLRRGVSVCMASSDGSAALSTTFAVPGAAGPVRVVAAPVLAEADFRNAVDSVLFKQWLRNLQAEKGVLSLGRLNLRQILIQGVDMFGERVGFLKFRADIVNEEIKAKVIRNSECCCPWCLLVFFPALILICVSLDLRCFVL